VLTGAPHDGQKREPEGTGRAHVAQAIIAMVQGYGPRGCDCVPDFVDVVWLARNGGICVSRVLSAVAEIVQGGTMQIAIGLYNGFTLLDWAGPYQVFTSVPGAEVILVASSAEPVVDDHALVRIPPTHTFGEVPSPDVVMIPGGLGTRKVAASGHPIVDWVRDVHERTTWTTSVCTGALVLGAAGLLQGLPATTHWLAYDDLAGYGATPTERRVVKHGRIVTGAGVSAGIDVAITMVAEIWGPEVAQAVQLGIEYDPQPPFDAGAPSKAAPEIRELVSATMSDLMANA
jgi:putative intracellular protease/amidase